MLLESNGIRIEVVAQDTINQLKNAGYVEVKGVKPKPKPKSRGGELADVPKAKKLSAPVKLALKALSLENPEALSAVTDEILLDIKGIAEGGLKAIRNDYPEVSEADNAPEGGDESVAEDGD